MPSKTKTRVITEEDALKLRGLQVLARQNQQENRRIAAAAADILGEEADERGFYGHADDFASDPDYRTVENWISVTGNRVDPAPDHA